MVERRRHQQKISVLPSAVQQLRLEASLASLTPLALLAVDPQFAGPDIVPNDNSVTRQGPFPVIGEANTEIKRNVFGSPFPREMAAEVILRKLVTVEVTLNSVRRPCCQEQRRDKTNVSAHFSSSPRRVFAQHILCWQDGAISRTVAAT